jgi:hypothetical protein
MSRKKKGQLSKEFEELRQDIDHWRKTRTKLTHMPEKLWSRAAKLAAVHGVTVVSNEMRLHYTKLRERAAEVQSAQPEEAIVPAATTFVELDPITVLNDSVGDVIVEVTGGDGSAMSLHLPALESRDVAGLVEAFFRRVR